MILLSVSGQQTVINPPKCLSFGFIIHLRFGKVPGSINPNLCVVHHTNKETDSPLVRTQCEEILGGFVRAWDKKLLPFNNPSIKRSETSTKPEGVHHPEVSSPSHMLISEDRQTSSPPCSNKTSAAL